MVTRDYDRIERAIHYLDERTAEQPELSDVARAAGLSEFHFQRMFTRWAGVSPKKFLQFLTAEHARRLLEDSPSVFDAALDAGLSGGGRLHDLTIAVHAMTPGELAGEGAGAQIGWGVAESPFGDVFVAATARGVTKMAFVDTFVAAEAEADELRHRYRKAEVSHTPKTIRALGRNVFSADGEPGSTPLALHVRGTRFQLKVWEALLRIPSGSAATYEAIANVVGAQSATRAVANAVAANPVAYLIPCHRVIRKTGAFGGYHWGVDRKRAMLGWESARAAS